MKIDKLSLDGKKNTIEVLDKIFSGKIHKKLVSNVLYKINANYKGRKVKTKQKNEIIGSTSKIYAQKGTGGARHASRKAPILLFDHPLAYFRYLSIQYLHNPLD